MIRHPREYILWEVCVEYTLTKQQERALQDCARCGICFKTYVEVGEAVLSRLLHCGNIEDDAVGDTPDNTHFTKSFWYDKLEDELKRKVSTRAVTFQCVARNVARKKGSNY